MSEAVAEKAEKAPAAGGGGKKLVIIMLALNVLLAGGLGFMFWKSSHAPDPAKAGAHKKAAAHGEEGEEGHGEKAEGEEEEEEEEEEGHDDKKHGKFGPLLEVGSFIANLAAAPGGTTRYAKVTLHAEALNEEAKARVEAGLVPLKSEALLVLSNAKPEDVIGPEKMQALAAELLKRGNKLLGKKSIKRMYFSELVVQ
ncbi:MAG: flagellar basal body-associated FliL family protein [Polyangiales bacterium]